MSVEIKTFGGRVLYTAEHAADVRAALVEAAGRGADLRGAYLQGADLRGADLQGAYLQGAYLRGAYLRGAYLRGADLQGAYLQGADLRGADLQGADLRGADLRGADLRGAYLRGAEDPRSPLHAIRADVWAILDLAPAEVPALRAKLVAGEINGSCYSGDCACLVGTIIQARDGQFDSDTTVCEIARKVGIVPDSGRPAEQWFMAIQPGHIPVDELPELPPFKRTDKPEPLPDGYPSEGVWRATHVRQWIDEWTESRSRIAAAFAAPSVQDEADA